MSLHRFQNDQLFRETHTKLNFYRHINLYNNEYDSCLLHIWDNLLKDF